MTFPNATNIWFLIEKNIDMYIFFSNSQQVKYFDFNLIEKDEDEVPAFVDLDILNNLMYSGINLFVTLDHIFSTT